MDIRWIKGVLWQSVRVKEKRVCVVDTKSSFSSLSFGWWEWEGIICVNKVKVRV